MLNLDETLEVTSPYNTQRDLLFKCFFYSFPLLVILDIVREQLPEINLLQLIPGYYLFLLFLTFIGLIVFSDNVVRVSFELENKKSFGTKIITKNIISSITKYSNIFLFSTILLSLATVIPIGLDSFNSYGEKTLENVWSIDEVISLELILLIILIIISQIPGAALSGLEGINTIDFLRKYWKLISLGTFILSGFITPTIDGYTQLSFSTFGLFFYTIVIVISLKRSLFLSLGSTNLGF
jgi:hypothetical protein